MKRVMSPKRSKHILLNLGIGKERDYLVENLSTLIAAGMPIISALDAIAQEIRSRRMRALLAFIREDILSGAPIWRALKESGLFADHAIALIRLGEESGKLSENLKVVAIEEEKSRVFRSKLHSAMLYPVFVLSLTVTIGVGIAWFILPKLAVVFTQLHVTLPLITKVLISIGIYLDKYGVIVIPTAVVIVAALFYFLFIFSKTKVIGQSILLSLPGINQLIKEVEIARFGYLLGTLLEAGLPITHALDSLARATEIVQYRKLYRHLCDAVSDGNSFQKSFLLFHRTDTLIAAPIQQLIVVGERSGTLSLTLLKIGKAYEVKSDTTTKNLTVILEPILLVIVWLGVVAVALAVILPIYSLIGGFNPQ
jgi:type II secretory pathway component PulF